MSLKWGPLWCIGVVFVRPHKSTVRYMVTLHKNDKVQRLRRELQTMTATENSDVILAEVLDNHISRLLVSCYVTLCVCVCVRERDREQ